jgi:hypothetical protein
MDRPAQKSGRKRKGSPSADREKTKKQKREPEKPSREVRRIVSVFFCTHCRRWIDEHRYKKHFCEQWDYKLSEWKDTGRTPPRNQQPDFRILTSDEILRHIPDWFRDKRIDPTTWIPKSIVEILNAHVGIPSKADF